MQTPIFSSKQFFKSKCTIFGIQNFLKKLTAAGNSTQFSDFFHTYSTKFSLGIFLQGPNGELTIPPVKCPCTFGSKFCTAAAAFVASKTKFLFARHFFKIFAQRPLVVVIFIKRDIFTSWCLQSECVLQTVEFKLARTARTLTICLITTTEQIYTYC